MEFSHGLDANTGGIARQIGKRHVLDIDDFDGIPRAHRQQRPRRSRGPWHLQAPFHDRFGQRIDAVDFAGNLRDGRTDGVGDAEMRSA
jgi:hypothetical protein